MSNNLFVDVHKLLVDYTEELDRHSLGNPYREEAQRIIEELNILIKNKHFIEHIEEEIEEEERRQATDDIADEILNRGCINGRCEI